MKRSNSEYQQLCRELSPPSPSFRTVPAAFLVGGAICALGQLCRALLLRAGLPEKAAAAGVSCLLVLLGVALTAARLFEKLAKRAGAGTLVPITGFANAVVSPAIEFRVEGLVTGVAAKMFVIAGPVIIYGTLASVIWGVVYWAAGAF